MSIKQFLDKILKNWPVKVTCFVMAVLIYFFHQISTIDKKTFVVSLEVKSEGAMVLSGGYERHRNVKIIVRARAEQLASVSEKDLRAYVDLSSQSSAGQHNFPVLLDLEERILLMDPLEITASPDSVPLSIEERDVKFVGIRPSVSGIPSHGYTLSKITSDPATVRVEGPRSVVSKITYMPTEEVSVQNATSDVTKKVSVLNRNSLISVGTGTFSVNARIVPQGMVKTFSDIPVSFDNLRDDLAVSGEPVFVDVIVEGELLDIEKLSADSVRGSVDCSFILTPGHYEVPVSVTVPLGLTVNSKSRETLSLDVVLKPEETLPDSSAVNDGEEKDAENTQPQEEMEAVPEDVTDIPQSDAVPEPQIQGV